MEDRPAVHLCSVPTEALSALVEHHPVVDLDECQGSLRLVGRLRTAVAMGDGTIRGTLDIQVRGRRLPAWRGGDVPYRTVTPAFVIDPRFKPRVTAHLTASLLESTPGAFDVELG